MLVPEESMALVTPDDVKFRCISCHWLKDMKAGQVTPYFVSKPLSQLLPALTRLISQGFLSDEEPVLPSFLKVTGRFELSTRSHITSASILLLHFRNSSIISSTPMTMVRDLLTPYFPHGGFRFEEVEFDLGTDEGIHAFTTAAQSLASELSAGHFQRVLVGVTNHTDEESGDLFLGFDTSAGHNVSASVDEVRTFFSVYLGSTPFSYCISCGRHSGPSFVERFSICSHVAPSTARQRAHLHCSSHSLGELVIATNECYYILKIILYLRRFRFSHAIAFDTLHLQPNVASHFLLTLTEAIQIEGFPVAEAVLHALGWSGRLGMHSNVIYIALAEQQSSVAVQVTKFVWSHHDLHPWGADLPLQCPQCGTPQSWVHVVIGTSYKFECRYRRCGREKRQRQADGPYSTTVHRPAGSELLPNGRRAGSGWLKIAGVGRTFAVSGASAQLVEAQSTPA
jgi:hypothetical protein